VTAGTTVGTRPDHDAPLTPKSRHFLQRLTVATGGGMFIDGFVFATFASAMAGKAKDQLHVTTLWESWISASVLIGTFFGGLLLGYVTDRIGRKPMFTFDLMLFSGCALLLFFVTAPWQVFVLGILMGLAVGADYSIGSPLLGEFAQRKTRGNYLGLLEIGWNVGYVVAYLIGYLINTYAADWWRVILGMSIVPAVISLIVRHGLPESPRWLVSKGRRKEAVAIYRDQLDLQHPGDLLEEPEQETKWMVLFSRQYIRRTLFASLSWSAIVMPYFALTFFGPDILKALGMGSGSLLGALLGTIVALVGATISWYIVDKVGRRKVVILPMFGCAGALFLASMYLHMPIIFGVVAYFGYLFSYGIMSITTGIYPEEVFPSSVRASGVGLSSSVSRVAAAIGTWGLPPVKEHFGVSTVLIILGVVSALGGILSFAWAPETNGKSLTETSHEADPHEYRGREPQPV